MTLSSRTTTAASLERNLRGIKRKRPHDEASEEDRGAKLRRKLHHTLRELRKVFKKAKTFEVQKILKRLKDARRKSPEGDVTRHLAAQMEILKHLSFDQLALTALISKLKKDKTLSADPTVQAVLVEWSSNLVSPGAQGPPTVKVQSRILSSKVLASEVISMLETLKTFLHSPLGLDGTIREATGGPRGSPSTSKKRTHSGPGKDVFSSKDNVADPSAEGSDEEFQNSASGNDDDWDSSTVGAPSGSDDGGGAGDHDSGSTSEDSSNVHFPSKDNRDHTSNGNKLKSHGPRDQSEFLPSLSVGFVQGDSGSEFSDREARLVDGIKKNRRGQRARRAIWEKRFGKNANHIKRRRRDAERRNPGSVPVDRRSGKGNSSLNSRSRRTPVQSRAHPSGNEQVSRPALKRSQDVKHSGLNKGQSGGDTRGHQGERPLHPSWEAKKKHESASIVPSQGTMVIFSE